MFESMMLEDMRIYAEVAKRHPEERNAADVVRLATMTLALLSYVVWATAQSGGRSGYA